MFYSAFGCITTVLFDTKNMSMPLGISFLTFSILSYWIDIYNSKEEGCLLDVALHVSFFPKVISGPQHIRHIFHTCTIDNSFQTVDNDYHIFEYK